MVASISVPLDSSTLIVPVSAAPATTWLLVMMWPLASATKPDPVPVPSAPFTRIVTTLGRALAAMLAIEPSGRLVAPPPTLGIEEAERCPKSRRSLDPSHPPATPPRRPASSALTAATPTSAPQPGPRRLSVAWVVAWCACVQSWPWPSPVYAGYAGEPAGAPQAWYSWPGWAGGCGSWVHPGCGGGSPWRVWVCDTSR